MSDSPETVPVTVVIPTIGRLEPLRRCLESLARSVPPPDEILVVDQSHDPAIEAVVAKLAG
jgi:GT2 family glycosyltransferase